MNTEPEAKPMLSITCPVTGLHLPALALVLVVFFISISVIMSIWFPALWTLPWEVVFQVGLMLASVWLGVVMGSNRTSTTWLQAARQACDSLTTLCYDVESITKDQKAACVQAAELLPKDNASVLPVRVYLQMLCQQSSSRLTSIQRGVNDTHRVLVEFVAQHCNGQDCKLIVDEIKKRQAEIFNKCAKCGDVETLTQNRLAVTDQ